MSKPGAKGVKPPVSKSHQQSGVVVLDDIPCEWGELPEDKAKASENDRNAPKILVLGIPGIVLNVG